MTEHIWNQGHTSMEKAREFGRVPASSSSGMWIDTTKDVKHVKLIDSKVDLKVVDSTEDRNINFEFQPGKDMTEAQRQQQMVNPHLTNEKFVGVAKEQVQRPTIIDLDAYEGGEEGPSDMSMALVVAATPDGARENDRSTERAIVRSDNTHSGETTSQSGALKNVVSQSDALTNEHARNGFNTSTAELLAERVSPGNGHTAPRPGRWEGPPRWASSHVGILTVQCARCLKWRVVPTKEQYEAIREHILETPWVCENALEWRHDAHCDLPTDLNQDSQTLWAIDRPNLPSSPPGWHRKVIVRKDCSTKFADVYYNAPDGKSLRSMVEVAKYLEENPASVPEGTQLNQFSFTIPRPLPGVWSARKRNTMRSVVSLSNTQGKKARAPQPLAKQLAQKLLHGTNPPLLPVAPPSPLPVAPSLLLPIPPSLSSSFEPPSMQPMASVIRSHPSSPSFNTSSIPLPYEPSSGQPIGPSCPPTPTFTNLRTSLPSEPPLAQPLATVVPGYPPVPNFTNFPIPSDNESPLVQRLAMLVPSYPPAPNFTNLPTPPSLPTLPHMRNPYPPSMAFGGSNSQALPQVTCYSSQRGMLTSSTTSSTAWQPERSSTASVSMRRKQQQKSRLGVVTSLSQNLNLPGILPLREPNGILPLREPNGI